MVYINGKSVYDNEVETIDQFSTRKEARTMLQEYKLAYGGSYTLWLSQRATKEWRESDKR